MEEYGCDTLRLHFTKPIADLIPIVYSKPTNLTHTQTTIGEEIERERAIERCTQQQQTPTHSNN